MLLPHTLQLRAPIHIENAIWFIIPAGLSLLLLIYTLWVKKDIKLLILFLGLGAISGFLEDVIFIGLQSYEYYPGILKNDYYDMVLGAYLSQVFYVASVALFIAAFHLRIRWHLLFVLMFVGLEYLFLSLGIYKHNWWQSGYTAIGLLIYFYISKKWYKSLIVPSRFIRWFSLFCVSYIIYSNLMFIPLLFNHLQFNFVDDWFMNAARGTVVILILMLLLRSIVISLVCYYRLHWIIMALVVLMMWVSNLIMVRSHIMEFKYNWDFLYFAATDIAVLLICCKCNRVLSKRG